MSWGTQLEPTQQAAPQQEASASSLGGLQEAPSSPPVAEATWGAQPAPEVAQGAQPAPEVAQGAQPGRAVTRLSLAGLCDEPFDFESLEEPSIAPKEPEGQPGGAPKGPEGTKVGVHKGFMGCVVEFLV